MRIPVSNAVSCWTTARPCGSQRPVGRSRFSLSLSDRRLSSISKVPFHYPEETIHVLAWLSIGGVHQGSRFADWALNPTVCWLSQLNLGVQGFDLEDAMSCSACSARVSSSGR